MAFREEFRPELPVVLDMMGVMNSMEVPDDEDLLEQRVESYIQGAGFNIPDLSLGKLDIPNLRISQVVPLLYETYANLGDQERNLAEADLLEDARAITGYATFITELFERWQPGVIYAPRMLITARQSFAVSALGMQRHRAGLVESPDVLLASQVHIVTAHGVALSALADVSERLGSDILEPKKLD